MLSYEIKGGAVFYCPGIRYFALVMLTLFTNAQARGEEQFNLNALSHDSPLADSAVLKKLFRIMNCWPETIYPPFISI